MERVERTLQTQKMRNVQKKRINRRHKWQKSSPDFERMTQKIFVRDLFFRKSKGKKIPKKWSSTLNPVYCEKNRATFLPSADIWPQKKATNQSKETSSLWQTHASILEIIIVLTALACVLMTTCLEENKCTSGCSFCPQKYEVWGEKKNFNPGRRRVHIV